MLHIKPVYENYVLFRRFLNFEENVWS